MFGRKTHQIVSVSVFRILLAMGLISMLGLLYEFFSENFDNTVFIAFKNIFFPALNYLKEKLPFLFRIWSGWLFWALIAKFALKLHHPPVEDNRPLGNSRMIIGYLTLMILFLSFSYNGIYIK
jgi:hypothetical protein